MERLLLVGAGGFLGSVLRYLVSGWVQERTGTLFPLGTLTVNVVGCLIIGVLSYLADTRALFSPETRAFTFIGILGGFTTFSSFGNETLALARDGETAAALLNIGGSLALGLGAVWLGRALAGIVWR